MLKEYYTGIGSRSTPLIILDIFEKLGYIFAKSNLILRSGGADGADSAFELGCNVFKGNKEIYLPWKNFNNNNSKLYNIPNEAFIIAKKIHPNWNNLKDSVKKLHARNICQILGYDLKSPSKFVICWTPEGKAIGGTATAINTAKIYGIPVFNLGLDNINDIENSGKEFNRFKEFLKTFIK